MKCLLLILSTFIFVLYLLIPNWMLIYLSKYIMTADLVLSTCTFPPVLESTHIQLCILQQFFGWPTSQWGKEMGHHYWKVPHNVIARAIIPALSRHALSGPTSDVVIGYLCPLSIMELLWHVWWFFSHLGMPQVVLLPFNVLSNRIWLATNKPPHKPLLLKLPSSN